MNFKSLLDLKDISNYLFAWLSLKDLISLSLSNKFVRSKTLSLIEDRLKDIRLIKFSSKWKLVVDFSFFLKTFQNQSIEVINLSNDCFLKHLSTKIWIQFIKSNACKLYSICIRSKSLFIDTSIPIFIQFTDEEDNSLEIMIAESKSEWAILSSLVIPIVISL